jgi:hypothetical protein
VRRSTTSSRNSTSVPNSVCVNDSWDFWAIDAFSRRLNLY